MGREFSQIILPKCPTCTRDIIHNTCNSVYLYFTSICKCVFLCLSNFMVFNNYTGLYVGWKKHLHQQQVLDLWRNHFLCQAIPASQTCWNTSKRFKENLTFLSDLSLSLSWSKYIYQVHLVPVNRNCTCISPLISTFKLNANNASKSKITKSTNLVRKQKIYLHSSTRVYPLLISVM